MVQAKEREQIKEGAVARQPKEKVKGNKRTFTNLIRKEVAQMQNNAIRKQPCNIVWPTISDFESENPRSNRGRAINLFQIKGVN